MITAIQEIEIKVNKAAEQIGINNLVPEKLNYATLNLYKR